MTLSMTLHNELNILKPDKKHQFHTCCKMHKIYHAKAPDCLTNKFKHVKDIRSWTTCGAEHDKYYIHKCKTKLAIGNFMIAGVSYWYAIPDDILGIEKNKVFKVALQAHLLRATATHALRQTLSHLLRAHVWCYSYHIVSIWIPLQWDK